MGLLKSPVCVLRQLKDVPRRIFRCIEKSCMFFYNLLGIFSLVPVLRSFCSRCF